MTGYQITLKYCVPLFKHKLTQHQSVTVEQPEVCLLYLIVPDSYVLTDTCFIVVLMYEKITRAHKNTEKLPKLSFFFFLIRL